MIEVSCCKTRKYLEDIIMNQKLLKFSLVCASGALFLAANPKTAFAFEEPVAGFTYDKLNNSTEDNGDNAISISSLLNYPIPGFTNLGIVNVETNLMVRSGPGTDYKIVGKIPKDGGCEIIEEDDGSGWTKITSGKVTGYVKSEYLITGPEASKLALKVGNYIAKSNANGSLRVRKEPSTDSEILDVIGKGEELLVLDSIVNTDGEDHNKWVKVSLDSDDSSEGTVAYVAKEYVDISFALKKAFTLEELEYGSGVSSTRANMINYAKQFLGNRYVYGGNSLTNGIDCSAFVMKIYAKYGYSIPRNSRSQAASGTKISASKLKPGDLVFYGKSGYINHVAMYIGNNKVIHASNKRDGIKISNMNYRTPLKYVRYIND